MDNEGLMALKTLQKIEQRLIELLQPFSPPSARQVAVEIINAIREVRGEPPKKFDSTDK